MSIVDELRNLGHERPRPMAVAVPRRRSRHRVRGRGRRRRLLVRDPGRDAAARARATGRARSRTQFEDRQRKAANFDAYRAQLAEIERDFGAMLRQLPGKTEVPSLLVDISQTGLGAGLEEQLFQPTVEIQKDFYAEYPIRLRYTGSYHELGNFVSGIAALPRIVTLHDITIRPQSSDSSPDELTLDVTAKTYRYLDEEATEG